jgi:F420-dependent oxidoreductase-like protein
MPLRFGLQIPSFSFASRPRDNVFSVTRDIARRAESEGFDSLWLMDHLFQIPIVAPETEPLLDCWTGLAALAECTQRIRLGTLVAAAGFRPPSIVAKMTSTLDVISGGRLTVGMGAGWCEWEHRGYGLPFPPVAERLERLEEALCILRAMWTEERATFIGKHFRVEGAVCSPKPVQKPHPPLLIGGSGARVTLRLAAQYAQAHNIGAGSPAECRRVLARLREHCERLGTDYAAIEKSRLTPILFGASAQDAQRRAEELRPQAETPEAFRARTLIGTPEQVSEQLQEFIDAGVETFVTSFWDVDELEPLSILMREVAPRLREPARS